jgi:hypothetical protein
VCVRERERERENERERGRERTRMRERERETEIEREIDRERETYLFWMEYFILCKVSSPTTRIPTPPDWIKGWSLFTLF